MDYTSVRPRVQDKNFRDPVLDFSFCDIRHLGHVLTKVRYQGVRGRQGPCLVDVEPPIHLQLLTVDGQPTTSGRLLAGASGYSMTRRQWWYACCFAL